MSYYNQGYQPSPNPSNSAAQNLQFYPSSYSGVSGHTTPSQASYGGYGQTGSGGAGAGSNSYASYGGGAGSAGGGGPAVAGFGGVSGVSGRMGEQGGLRTGWIAAFSTEGYEGEPGLMEELGVNFGHIRTKTMTVLNPLSRPSPHIMDDSDLWGALIYVCAYGAFLAISGKFAWGYIYGIALFGSIALHWIFALMTPPIDPNDAPQQHMMDHNMMGQGLRDHADAGQGHGGSFSATLTYSRSASVLGYCFLPLALIALFGVALPMDTAIGYFLTAAAVGWSTYSSSGMFISVGRMKGMRGLVAYPLALFYCGFGIMGIFSSRGSGMLEGKVM